MTYTLSIDQISDFYADLDLSEGDVFGVDDLQRLYNRASGSYEGAVALAWRQLLASASKLSDYKAAQSGESLSQVYNHVKEMLELWEGYAASGGYSFDVGTIGLNIDATEDNASEWDGSSD